MPERERIRCEQNPDGGFGREDDRLAGEDEVAALDAIRDDTSDRSE